MKFLFSYLNFSINVEIFLDVVPGNFFGRTFFFLFLIQWEFKRLPDNQNVMLQVFGNKKCIYLHWAMQNLWPIYGLVLNVKAWHLRYDYIYIFFFSFCDKWITYWVITDWRLYTAVFSPSALTRPKIWLKMPT